MKTVPSSENPRPFSIADYFSLIRSSTSGFGLKQPGRDTRTTEQINQEFDEARAQSVALIENHRRLSPTIVEGTIVRPSRRYVPLLESDTDSPQPDFENSVPGPEYNHLGDKRGVWIALGMIGLGFTVCYGAYLLDYFSVH